MNYSCPFCSSPNLVEARREEIGDIIFRCMHCWRLSIARARDQRGEGRTGMRASQSLLREVRDGAELKGDYSRSDTES